MSSGKSSFAPYALVAMLAIAPGAAPFFGTQLFLHLASGVGFGIAEQCLAELLADLGADDRADRTAT